MNPWLPLIKAQGDGGTIELEGGKPIGTVGEWQVKTYGDDERPFLTATGCNVAAYWRSAGVQRLIVRSRPRQHAAGAPLIVIAGDVKLLEKDRLNLGNLTIVGITKDDQGDGD